MDLGKGGKAVLLGGGGGGTIYQNTTTKITQVKFFPKETFKITLKSFSYPIKIDHHA